MWKSNTTYNNQKLNDRKHDSILTPFALFMPCFLFLVKSYLIQVKAYHFKTIL